jgi:hypothetical protein
MLSRCCCSEAPEGLPLSKVHATSAGESSIITHEKSGRARAWKRRLLRYSPICRTQARCTAPRSKCAQVHSYPSKLDDPFLYCCCYDTYVHAVARARLNNCKWSRCGHLVSLLTSIASSAASSCFCLSLAAASAEARSLSAAASRSRASCRHSRAAVGGVEVEDQVTCLGWEEGAVRVNPS